MKNGIRVSVVMLVTCVALALSACGGSGNTAPVPTGAPNPSSNSAPTAAAPAPTQPASAAPTGAAAAPSAGGENNLPAWWPKELAMPKGTTLQSEAQGIAFWANSDPKRDGIRDFLANEAKAAGYRVLSTKDDIGFTLYFFKDANGYSINILKDSLTGTAIGGIHAKTSGAVTAEFDVPVPPDMRVQTGAALDLKGFLRQVPCDDCNYSVSVILDPYTGKGTFKASSDMRVAAEVIPGLNPTKEDYKGGECTVVVQDGRSGNFSCTGMTNVYDQSKKLDVTGEWHLVASAAPAAAVEPTDTPEAGPTERAPATPAAAGKAARMAYQLNLKGAVNLSATTTQEEPRLDDCSQVLTLLAMTVSIKSGDNTVVFGGGQPALAGKPGTFLLDAGSQVGLAIADANLAGDTYQPAEGSSGTLTMNPDGSGQLTLSDWKGASGETESGTIAWTCSQ